MDMNKIILFVCMGLFVRVGYCQTSSITVTIRNIKDSQGSIMVGLYTSEGDFLKKPAYGKAAKANGNEVTVVFDKLPVGDYAISVIHDENDNHDFDRNKLGIPKEGYCFGNNATGKLGPPKYDDVKVSLTEEPINQIIEMHYL
jgi:uncharacterized protein (DUF2141 family)